MTDSHVLTTLGQNSKLNLPFRCFLSTKFAKENKLFSIDRYCFSQQGCDLPSSNGHFGEVVEVRLCCGSFDLFSLFPKNCLKSESAAYFIAILCPVM